MSEDLWDPDCLVQAPNSWISPKIDKGRRINHEVHIVNWNTGILEAENA